MDTNTRSRNGEREEDRHEDDVWVRIRNIIAGL